MHSKICKNVVGIALAIGIAVPVGIATAPVAEAAQKWPTYARVITNKAAFDNGKSFYRIKVRAQDAYGNAIRGKASLYINGKAQRLRTLDHGWRGFLVGRKDLPNNKTSRIQVRITPSDGKRRQVKVVTRYVTDVQLTAGQKALSVAKKQVGDRYKYGASGPSAFDCSGLVAYSFKHATGKRLPHSSAGIKNSGHRVSKPRPGDIVYTKGHVSIYAGNGKVVEAANPRSGVRITKIWQRNPVYIRI